MRTFYNSPAACVGRSINEIHDKKKKANPTTSNGCLQLSKLMENIKIVLKQRHLEMCRQNNTSLESTLCNKGWSVVSLWLANMAAVRVGPFRAISVHVSLTPPTITKTSRSNYAHIARHFHQRFCQLHLPNSISHTCSQANILFR